MYVCQQIYGVFRGTVVFVNRYIAGEDGQGEEQRTARMRVRVIFLQLTDTVYYHTYRLVPLIR